MSGRDKRLMRRIGDVPFDPREVALTEGVDVTEIDIEPVFAMAQRTTNLAIGCCCNCNCCCNCCCSDIE